MFVKGFDSKLIKSRPQFGEPKKQTEDRTDQQSKWRSWIYVFWFVQVVLAHRSSGKYQDE